MRYDYVRRIIRTSYQYHKYLKLNISYFEYLIHQTFYGLNGSPLTNLSIKSFIGLG